MTTTRAQHRRRSSRRVRARRTLVAAVAVAVIAAGVTALALTRGPAAPPVADETAVVETPTSTPTPTPPALSAAQQLLATSTDARACAVSYEGEGIEIAPVLQTEGNRYQGLPIPRTAGRVFAGWYAAATDAAALNLSARLNGADLVSCTDRERTLHAGWTSPEANTAEAAGIPILMYHQFTRNPQGEDTWLRLNYAYVGDFDAQMAYIQQSGFYLPTWDELSAFIDGALYLPKHSVIITDDDADSSWLELAAPIVDGRNLLTTSFVITSSRTEPTPNQFVLQRSHTHDLHRAGANGKGRMVNDDVDTIAADLEKSAEILGAKEVVAYPFGHYNDTTKEALRKAGFEMGRTVEQGYVRIGTDKLALPVVRMNYGMTVDDLKGYIG